jgi:cytochrome P450
MALFRARLIDSLSEKEDSFEFDAHEDLMNDTPVRIVRSFFGGSDPSRFHTRHQDWELNAAFKNRERGVVTCMGSFHLDGEPPVPFLLLIQPKPGASGG